MTLSSVSDSSFSSDVLESPTPVLVDFWAEWCGPCRMLTPILEQVAQELGEEVKVVKMNIDENPKTPSNFGVQSIPTMIIFKGGEAVATKVGNLPKNDIVAWLKSSV